MSDPVDFSLARAALTRSPPPGAEARVLGRLNASGERPRVRPFTPAVVVLATLVTTTAAAVGVTVVPRWVERRFAIAGGTHPAAALPRAAAPTVRNLPKPAVPPEAPSAAPASPVPWPDLPAPPPAPPEAKPTAAVLPHSPSSAASASAATPSESLLAQQVAAYREAAALATTSPGLAIVRLRAFLERWPTSPLGEEASVRLVQAFAALGRNADARAQASAFVSRYPHSPRRPEMEALATGARLGQ